MRVRRLGSTGLNVSEIGFGCWGIGGIGRGSVSYGPTDDKESKKALRLAYESGINFYDTADLYGHGHSEKLIGETFKNVRKNVVIATKGGLINPKGESNFSSLRIRKSVEGSLRRLKTDYVDLYQLHSPSLRLLEQNLRILRLLEFFKKEGKIRAFGISLRSPDDGRVAITRFGFQAIQVNFNLVDQRALENGLLDLCKREDVGVIVRTPLCFGFLTGAYPADSRFEYRDHRDRWQLEQRKLWADASVRFASALNLKPNLENNIKTALQFCLYHPAVSTIIPGMTTWKHVRDNLKASRARSFTKEEIRKLEKVYQSHRFFIK